MAALRRGSKDLRLVKSKIGLAEWGLLAGVTIIAGGTGAAIFAGLGLVFAIVALGYSLVLTLTYLLFRRLKIDWEE